MLNLSAVLVEVVIASATLLKIEILIIFQGFDHNLPRAFFHRTPSVAPSLCYFKIQKPPLKDVLQK